MTTKVTVQNLTGAGDTSPHNVEVCEYVEGSDWYGPKHLLLPGEKVELLVYGSKVLLVKEEPLV